LYSLHPTRLNYAEKRFADEVVNLTEVFVDMTRMNQQVA